MASLTVTQGDSSNVLNLKVTINKVQVTDLTGYTCRYFIIDNLQNVAQASQNIAASTSVFPLKLLPSESALLAQGSYRICSEIANASSNFKRETVVTLTITEQCLV